MRPIIPLFRPVLAQPAALLALGAPVEHQHLGGAGAAGPVERISLNAVQMAWVPMGTYHYIPFWASIKR